MAEGAQIFGIGSNSAARVTIIAAILGIFGLWGVGYFIYGSPYTTDVNVPRVQQVPFSHQHHVAGLGIDCRYCHTTAETSSFAGIPPTEICMTCHSKVWTDAPMLAPVRQSLATRQPLHWTRVNQVPDFVFFNHSIHVQKGIGCSSCHGEVNQMPLTWKSQTLYMRWCLDCHEAPEKILRPREQIFDMQWTAPGNQADLGNRLAQQFHITGERKAELKDCGMCHR